MQQKKPVFTRSNQRAPLRPGQDFVVRKRASQFPGVGVTLQAYKQTPQANPLPRQRPGSTQTGALPGARPVTPRPNTFRPEPQAQPQKTSRFKRLLHGITLKRVTLTFASLLLLVVLFVGGKFLWNAHKLFGGNILGVLSSTKLDGEDTGRVNILLAGNSADDAGHQGAQLTDSIMLISIDTKHNKAFLMSIPRDLYVSIPDEGYNKINYAYVAGEQNHFSENGYPSGGMGLLEKVVEDNFNIPINYYALVNYNAFRDAVDAVGGIDITIKSDDPRGLYDPNIDYKTHKPLVKLSNGVHHLNGEQALDLARARGDSYRSYGFAGSDFDRTSHQRQMLVALKSKAVSAGVLANPAKLSSLFDAIGNNVHTDLKLPEVHRLYDLTKDINGGSIQSYSLNDAFGQNLLKNYTNPRGESTLVPAAGVDDYSDIQAFIKRITSNNPVVQEGASVVILNGTDKLGLASQERTKLVAKDINVDAIGDALQTQPTTTIIDVSGGKKPGTIAYLKSRYKATVTTVNPYKNTYDTDIIVVLGANVIPANSSSSNQ